MEKNGIIFLIGLVVFLTAGCTGRSNRDGGNDKITLAVSIEPLRNIVEQIAGDNFTVETILDKGANPETFDPSMSKRAAGAQCDVYFMLDAFPFESVIAKTSDNETVNVAEGIVPIYGTHCHHHNGGDADCHHEGDIDPHTWTSCINAAIIARNVASTLSRLYPNEADSIEIRLEQFVAENDSLDAAIRNSLAQSSAKAFAVWHPSLSYMARDYGLEQISVGQENKEVSARRLKDIIEDANAHEIKVFFFQKEFDSRQAETIAEELGARLIAINPLAYDWQSQLTLIADELSK